MASVYYQSIIFSISWDMGIFAESKRDAYHFYRRTDSSEDNSKF